jgi:hypothetical protein
VGVSGAGGTSLLLSLLVGSVARGSWAAMVGFPDLGIEAAAMLGLELERVALVPDPGTAWPSVVAVLLDAVEIVVVSPPRHCRFEDARRLSARVRERSGLLVVSGKGWPDKPDFELAVVTDHWEGLGSGYGTLRQRLVTLEVTGRRGADRLRSVSFWLPNGDGRLVTHRPELLLEKVPAREEQLGRAARAG